MEKSTHELLKGIEIEMKSHPHENDAQLRNEIRWIRRDPEWTSEHARFRAE